MAASAVTTLLCFVPGIAQADQASSDGCQPVSFQQPQGTLVGTLCVPSRSAKAVMVLMSGSNYNGTYWDFPYQPEKYNFRRAMNAAGFATLIVDRLGNGDSTHPRALSLSANTTATALHDMVQSLRHGLAGAQPFEKVVTVGHSLTSSTSIMEQIANHDVDGVLLTGYSHALDLPGVFSVIATYYPAVQDPKFANSGVDPNYLVSRPGTRVHDFFDPADVDPEVLKIDEANKEMFSISEYPDGLMTTLPGESSLMDVPVMIVNGGRDRMACGAGYVVCASPQSLLAEEAPYFSPKARLQTFVVPGSGHAINLALDTKDYQVAVVNWMSSTVLS
ncbi:MULTISPECIES: alpha/beta hydrolase [unclassified Nocardia]|uniref:alpha/beta hydrolase n=1 Tax=unclassified Nocardia TaxID=2637762 RepID=UPI001CE430B1|nr:MULTISPECIES: alpha/beta fold hydrolase [unclassified Nocardia]